jgi:hypothetical protein
LLEDAAARNRRPVRPHAEGRRLGVLAEEIEGRLPRPSVVHGPEASLSPSESSRFMTSSRGPGSTEHGSPDGALYRALADGRYVRAVNFHATPPRLAASLEEQLSRLAERFVPRLLR